MTTAVSQLPEAKALFNNYTGFAAYEAAALRRMLIKARTRHDLEACLRVIQVVASDAPLILVAFFGKEGLTGQQINLGWSERWLGLYEKQDYHLIDPIANAKPWAPVIWSPLVLGIPDGEKGEAFRRACIDYRMTHGMSCIGERDNCRIILSLIGSHIESDKSLRELLEILLPDLIEVAYRVFASNRATSKLEVMQQNLIDLYCNQGLSKAAVAASLGMSRKGVDYHLKKLQKQYNANTVEQLMFKIGMAE